eukprot:scaffold227084_cov23-Tisochrysis_lutea.AAC.1
MFELLLAIVGSPRLSKCIRPVVTQMAYTCIAYMQMVCTCVAYTEVHNHALHTAGGDTDSACMQTKWLVVTQMAYTCRAHMQFWKSEMQFWKSEIRIREASVPQYAIRHQRDCAHQSQVAYLGANVLSPAHLLEYEPGRQ